MISLKQHLDPSGPKRILALDGGGIRGAFTLGYLQKIEDSLKKQHNKPDLLLCDYFDLIGGTSTGAIIAACLAIGMPVSEIRDMYMNLGGEIFSKKNKWWNIFEIGKALKAGYDHGPLDKRLQEVFKNIKLGGPEIKTGLCIIAKRADTNSVWQLINHPDDKFYNTKDGTNSDILLWKAVRASAAAPSYFLPQVIDVGGGLPTAAFVDGGVSMANNPALQLLMVATLNGFPFKWKLGSDNILIVSVGTGMGRGIKLPERVSKNNLLDWAKQIPDMFMQDASWHNQTILQWLSKSPTAWHIDLQIGDLSQDYIISDPDKKSLLSYLRYNLWFDESSLNETMKQKGKSYDQERIDDLLEMSNAENRFELFEIGEQAAAVQIKVDHFPDVFKIG